MLEMGIGLLEDDPLLGVDLSAVASTKADENGRDDGSRAQNRNKGRHAAGMLADFGDYELLEEIGRGGQGIVYRAHQKSLNRTVALKVIGLGPWTTEAHLKRFRREAEAAARLEHPGIVPIHDVGERDGQCYFSMKFIEGGQLDEVVRREPISIRRAVELIAKVARTVHYAHEHGILHRDIKPGNILLDKNGEPHLTDFGLARLLDAQSSVTRTIDVLGTPSYMAPEQATGETTKLSKATDVYGLGAVLYQLLTGQPPFAGGTTYETIRLLRDTEPRQPRLLNPKVDRDLSTVCLKCLEKDPQRRYPSALALAEDLEHWLKHEPIRAKPSGFFTHTRKWVRRNPSTTVLVMLLIAFAVGLTLTVWNRKPPVVIPKSVAVLPFENLSEDPNNAYFAEGMQEEILTRLASVADLKVISRTSTQRYHSKPANVAEIAKQLGVANIVEGSVQKAADQVRVNVQLINAQTDSHLWADTYDRKLTDILGVESEIAKRITESLKATLTGREEQALAAKPTNNPEAYDAYLRGLAYAVKNTTTTNFIGAQKYFKEAVRLDPKFAISWALLSYIDSLGYLTTFLQPTVALREEARQAAETALTLQPNLGEAVLAKANYYYACLKDYDTAVHYFEQARRLLPNSSQIPESLAYVARRRGQWDRSESYFNEAERLDPRNVTLFSQHALSYSYLRRFPAALRKLEQVLDIIPDDVDTIALKAAIAQAEGDLPRAASLVASLHLKAGDAAALETQVYQAILERNVAQIIPRLKEALDEADPSLGYMNAELRFWLGWAQGIAGDRAAARETWRQARSELEPFLKEQPENFELLGDLALTNMGLGDKAAALALAERAMAAVPIEKDAIYGPFPLEILARVAAQVGEHDRAVVALQKLLSIPYTGTVGENVPLTPALLRLDPIWDPLRADPAFQKLCQETVDKSIAVLPFENLSRDPDNAYFAEGIEEEILTRLASIADLKVISRTSTQRYQSKPSDLGEIAKQLGVAHILEGSVQKAADQVRVNVQLINAQTDSHLWADSYDRKLTDILGVESEIAKRIAESLQAKLTGREEQALAVKPTNNPEAYDAYLRGVAFEARNYFSSYSQNLEREAAGFYERAVQVDPNFAIAWARLSHADALIYVNPHETTADAARGDAAKHALEQAQKLEPESSETLIALGHYQTMVLRDFALAKTTFERVRKLLPGNGDVRMFLATIARHQKRWDQSIASFEEALALDPRNVQLLDRAIWTYTMLRQFPAALKLLDRTLDIMPNDPDIMATKASIYQAQGNLQEAAKLLSGINEQSPNGFGRKINQLQYERNYGEAIRLQRARLAQFHYASELGRASDQVGLAYLQRLAGDTTGAKATAESVRSTLEKLYREQPDDGFHAMALAAAYALIGEKDLALKLAEGVGTPDPQRDENLAELQVLVGENSRAISILTQLLQTPYWAGSNSTPITPALLRLDPIWDPLRGDPVFQKLCAEK
jgi:TolB-like protein/Tfp pilus assembly protein PilF